MACWSASASDKDYRLETFFVSTAGTEGFDAGSGFLGVDLANISAGVRGLRTLGADAFKLAFRSTGFGLSTD